MAKIDAVHEQYDDAVDGWQMVLDCIAGGRQVKSRGETYLSKLSDQSADEYQRYRDRGNFFNGTATANRAQTGLLTRKPPEVATTLKDEWIADIDLQGNDLTTYIKQIAKTVSSTGRCATIIDWSEEEKRPYLSFYEEVDILNWHTTRVKGVNTLDYLKLAQRSDEVDESGTSTTTKEQIRIYRLDQGKLKIEIYEPTSEKSGDGSTVSEYKLAETLEPKRRGKHLGFIPVIFHGAENTKPEVGEVPLEDIASINLSHYQTSVDLEHARHIAALPTPYATGVDANSDFRLGTENAWVAEDPNAKFGFIEFTGSGLSELKDALKEKEQQMAALGARLLFAESRDAEAFETVQLRASADTASLSLMASVISVGISRSMQIAAWWTTSSQTENPHDNPEQNLVVLSQDFVTAGMPSDKITALVSALNLGAISYPTFFYQLQKGEIYPEGRSQEDEEADLEKPPAMPQPPVEPKKEDDE